MTDSGRLVSMPPHKGIKARVPFEKNLGQLSFLDFVFVFFNHVIKIIIFGKIFIIAEQANLPCGRGNDSQGISNCKGPTVGDETAADDEFSHLVGCGVTSLCAWSETVEDC